MTSILYCKSQTCISQIRALLQMWVFLLLWYCFLLVTHVSVHKGFCYCTLSLQGCLYVYRMNRPPDKLFIKKKILILKYRVILLLYIPWCVLISSCLLLDTTKKKLMEKGHVLTLTPVIIINNKFYMSYTFWQCLQISVRQAHSFASRIKCRHFKILDIIFIYHTLIHIGGFYF